MTNKVPMMVMMVEIMIDYDGDISVCFILQDDSESQRADHKSMVRGFNAASSNTLARYMFWFHIQTNTDNAYFSPFGMEQCFCP